MGNCSSSNNEDEWEYGTEAYWARERRDILASQNRLFRNVSRDSWKDALKKDATDDDNMAMAMNMCRNGYSADYIEKETGVIVVSG